MRTRLLIFVALAVLSPVVWLQAFQAEDLYIAQTSAGGATGANCANALAVTFFNSGANWGAGAGKISPDDTVHFCGTITTQLEAQGSGTSGHPINLDATGATFEAPFWTVTGAFYFPGVSHFILNGGGSGVIQNTANGDGLANQQVSSGIYMSSCDDIEVKNLTIANIYQHTQNSSSMGSPDSYGLADDGCSNTNWHNNTIHDVYTGMFRVASNSGSNLQWHDNTLSNFNWAAGITAAGAGVVLDGVYFYGNTCLMGNNWDDTGNNNHHNCVHAYTDPSADGRIQNLYFYNNKCKGETGQVWTATGCLFTEYGIESLWAFNNIFDGVMGDPADGYIDLEFGVISQTAYIANNIFIGTTTTGWTSSFGDVFPKCIMLANNSSMVATIKNNVCENVVYGVLTATGSTFTADNDVIYNAGTTGVVNGTFHSTFSDWQTAGYDASGSSADPNLTGTYTLGSGSSAIGLGANLYSTCNGQPTPGLGALCADYAGVVRPSMGAWDAGALQYTSGSVPTVTSPTISEVRYNSAWLTFSVSPTSSYVTCAVGTVSGVYSNQPCQMYQATNDSGAGNVSLAITGLAASTTYYVRAVAQPNNNNTTDRCIVDGCGAVEISFTTPAAPSLPIEPTAPTAYNPTRPNTSGYGVVVMTDGGAGGQCKVESSTVMGVSVGDLFQTVLNAVPYQTYIKIRAQKTCITAAAGTFSSGYILPDKGNDATCSSGWIVIGTENDGSFPPDGVATDPTLGVKYATIQSNVIATQTSLGEMFTTDYTGFGSTVSRCYWLEHMKLAPDPTDMSGQHKTFITFGSDSAADRNSDNIVASHLLLVGNSLGSTGGITLTGKKLAVSDSYITNIFSTSVFPTGLFMENNGTGPYNIENNSFVNVIGLTVYAEVNNGGASVSNITIKQNSLFMDLALKDNGYLFRQPIESKGGHKIALIGNTVDGAWTYQNDAPAFFLSGTNSYNPNAGIDNVLIEHNRIRNVPTVFDCWGTRPADNNPAANNPPTNIVMFRSNFADNLGYDGRIGAGSSGGGAVNQYIGHRPGCADLTVTGNTFGLSNPTDSRAGSTITFIPAIYQMGGGTTFAPSLRHTNNLEYVSVYPALGVDRLYADDPQATAAFPRTPAVVTNSTPVARLNSFAITFTNAGTSTSYNWGGNVHICGLTGTFPNTWVEQSQTDCTTAASGMPSGDTWAAGATIAAREAAMGYNPTTGVCTGCGGAGLSGGKAALYPYLGIVSGINVGVSGTTATFTYLAPNTDACYIDLSTDSFAHSTRTSDMGGSTSRNVPIALNPSTSYDWRLLCTKQQLNDGTSSEIWPSNQVTTGTFMSGFGSTGPRIYGRKVSQGKAQ